MTRSIAFLLTTIVILLFNVPIVLLTTFRQELRQTFSSLFLLMLFYSHTAIGCINLVVAIVYMIGITKNDFTSYLSMFGTEFSCIGYAAIVFSYSSVVGITMDRVLVLSSPVYYKTLNYRYPLLFLLVSLTFTASVFCTCFFAPGTFTNHIVGVFCISIAVYLLIANLVLIYKLKKHFTTKVHVLEVSAVDKEITKKFLKEIRKTKVSLLMNLTFFIFWSPALFYLIITGTFKDNNCCKIYNNGKLASWYMAMWNSVFHAIFYILLNKKLRRSFRTYLTCCLGR